MSDPPSKEEVELMIRRQLEAHELQNTIVGSLLLAFLLVAIFLIVNAPPH